MRCNRGKINSCVRERVWISGLCLLDENYLAVLLEDIFLYSGRCKVRQRGGREGLVYHWHQQPYDRCMQVA